MTCPTCNGKHWCNCGTSADSKMTKHTTQTQTAVSAEVLLACEVKTLNLKIEDLKKDILECIPYLTGHCDGYDQACNKLRRELINKWDLKAGD